MGEKLIDPKYNVCKKYRQVNLVNPYLNSIPANTFIGGVSATINTPALVATRLGISSSRIKSFSIVGSNIQFAVTGGSYTMPNVAFSSVTSLTYFNDSSGLVTLINLGAFNGCSALVSVSFPEVSIITSNGSGTNPVFGNCIAITSISIPKFANDASTKDAMFIGCSALTTLNFPLYNGKIGIFMFTNCSNLSTVNIGISGSVGDASYSGTKITTINLTSATSIGVSVFDGVTTLAGTVSCNICTSIGDRAFRNTRITSVSANNCSVIGATAFKDCISLVSSSFANLITLNSSSSGGNFGTFQNCTSMTSFYAPLLQTITNGWAFAGCTAINTINMPILTTLGASVSVSNANFLNIKTGCIITVPVALQTANSGAPHADLVYASGTRGATIVYV